MKKDIYIKKLQNNDCEQKDFGTTKYPGPVSLKDK